MNFRDYINEEFKKDIKLLTRIRKEFWEPFAKESGVSFSIKNIKDGVEITSDDIEKFDNALYDWMEKTSVELSISSPKNNKMTIKTYENEDLDESSDTERVMLDIENIKALQDVAQKLSKDDFAAGIKKWSHLFKRKIKFKNVDWDTVYNKLNTTK